MRIRTRPVPKNPTEPAATRRSEWEFDGVVRLTRIGTTYIATTVIMAIAAINTGNNSLYIAVSFMLGCLLLSGIASKGGLRHLEVEIEGIDEAWAGRPASGRLRVWSRSRFWNVRDVVLTSPSFTRPVLVPLLPARGQTTVVTEYLFERRGRARLSAIDSYTRYPFGFFLKKRRLRAESEVIVFPRLLPEEVVEKRFKPERGAQVSAPRRGAGTEVHSFREFAPGDSTRHVHWKKSASLGRWIVKQPAAEAARTVHLFVDPHRPPGVTDESFEEMISAAATFINQANGRGYEIILSLPSGQIRAAASAPAAPLFRALALVEPAHEPMPRAFDRHAIVFSATGDLHDAESA